MYVIVDGIDGSGKSSLILDLSTKIRNAGLIPINLVEPSYGKYGRAIRKILGSNEPRDVELERELFTKDRTDHVNRVIKPLLSLAEENQNFVIIQDRGYLSYPAYQAREDAEIDEMLSQHAKIAPTPDFFFILDLPPETALKRIAAGRPTSALLERLEVLEVARARYLSLPDRLGDHIVVVDADRETDIVSQQVLNIMRVFDGD